MKIFALDQSLTGTASFLIDFKSQDEAKVLDQKIFKTKLRGIYRLKHLKDEIEKYINSHEIDVFVRELHNFTQYGSSNGLHALNGLIDVIALEKRYLDTFDYMMISPTMWKKFCLGKGNVAKDTGYLLKIDSFVKKLKWWDYGQIEDDNVADALCIAVTAFFVKSYSEGEMFENLTKLKQEVLKKAVKVCFNYEGKKIK